jgi:general nucleoside transport system permease protein
MTSLLASLLHSVLDTAPPLVLAAVGATVCERAGVVNVGIEGMMRAGAFAAAATALLVPTPAAAVFGALAGMGIAGIHALFCIRWRSDQVVSGMALNLVVLALGTFLLEALFESPSGTPAITPMSRIFGHTVFTWLTLVIPAVAHLVLYFTAWGVRLRAVGEAPKSAAAAGVGVNRLRALATLASGGLAGLGGAALSVGMLDHFEHHMPAGLGFMAVAAMVFGRWTPLGAAAAAVFFALGDGLRIGLASSYPELSSHIPNGLLLALPYLLTLLILAARRSPTVAPAALGTPFDPELR